MSALMGLIMYGWPKLWNLLVHSPRREMELNTTSTQDMGLRAIPLMQGVEERAGSFTHTYLHMPCPWWCLPFPSHGIGPTSL